DAVSQYLTDFNTKARVELSEEDFWMTRPPLAAPDPPLSTNRKAGIFRMQMGAAWDKYWAQVEASTRTCRSPYRSASPRPPATPGSNRPTLRRCSNSSAREVTSRDPSRRSSM